MKRDLVALIKIDLRDINQILVNYWLRLSSSLFVFNKRFPYGWRLHPACVA